MDKQKLIRKYKNAIRNIEGYPVGYFADAQVNAIKEIKKITKNGEPLVADDFFRILEKRVNEQIRLRGKSRSIYIMYDLDIDRAAENFAENVLEKSIWEIAIDVIKKIISFFKRKQ
jgi:hypothetical protein